MRVTWNTNLANLAKIAESNLVKAYFSNAMVLIMKDNIGVRALVYRHNMSLWIPLDRGDDYISAPLRFYVQDIIGLFKYLSFNQHVLRAEPLNLTMNFHGDTVTINTGYGEFPVKIPDQDIAPLFPSSQKSVLKFWDMEVAIVALMVAYSGKMQLQKLISRYLEVRTGSDYIKILARNYNSVTYGKKTYQWPAYDTSVVLMLPVIFFQIIYRFYSAGHRFAYDVVYGDDTVSLRMSGRRATNILTMKACPYKKLGIMSNLPELPESSKRKTCTVRVKYEEFVRGLINAARFSKTCTKSFVKVSLLRRGLELAPLGKENLPVVQVDGVVHNYRNMAPAIFQTTDFSQITLRTRRFMSSGQTVDLELRFVVDESGECHWVLVSYPKSKPDTEVVAIIPGFRIKNKENDDDD